MQDSTKQIVLDLANEFGIKPETLVGVIQMESSWNPQAKNPNSSARGLIQFIDSTAKSLGYANSLDLVTKNPDVDSQLKGPVRQYFRQFRPYTDDSFLLAAFYPAYRNKPLDTVFPDNVQKANPGIVTINDYVSKVKSRIKAYQVVKGF